MPESETTPQKPDNKALPTPPSMDDIAFPDEAYETLGKVLDEAEKISVKPADKTENKPATEADAESGGEPENEQSGKPQEKPSAEPENMSERTTEEPEPDGKEKPPKDQREESPDKEQSSNDDIENKGGTFLERVTQLISVYDTPEEQEQLLKDLENRDKFFASATQKSQEVSRLAKKYGIEKVEMADQLLERFGVVKINEALEALLKFRDTGLDDFLAATDDYFTDEEENPIRPLLEILIAKYPEIQKHHQEQKEISDEKAALAFEKEVIALRRIDPAYDTPENLKELVDIADKKKLDLVTAHELRVSNQRAVEIESLYQQVKDLSKELKQRNKEIDDLRRGQTPIDQPKPKVVKKGARKQGYAESPKTWEEAEERMRHEFYERMAAAG